MTSPIRPRLSDVARKGVRVTNVSGRGPAYGQLAPNDIILGELYPAKRDIRSVADLESALSSIKGGDVIEFLVCAPNPPTRQCQTRAVSLQVGQVGSGVYEFTKRRGVANGDSPFFWVIGVRLEFHRSNASRWNDEIRV